jgi:hypothetical protein
LQIHNTLPATMVNYVSVIELSTGFSGMLLFLQKSIMLISHAGLGHFAIRWQLSIMFFQLAVLTSSCSFTSQAALINCKSCESCVSNCDSPDSDISPFFSWEHVFPESVTWLSMYVH